MAYEFSNGEITLIRMALSYKMRELADDIRRRKQKIEEYEHDIKNVVDADVVSLKRSIGFLQGEIIMLQTDIDLLNSIYKRKDLPV